MPTTYRQFTLSCLFLLLAAGSCAQPDTIRITRLLDSTMRAENIPAVSLTIVHQGNAYYINRGTTNRGTTNRKSGTDVDENSLYQIASLGKPLVAIVMKELLVTGKLRTDQPITDFFKGPFSEKRTKRLQQITVGHLLHHSGGLPQDANGVYRRKDGEPYNYDYQPEDFITDLQKAKLKKPGRYRYSNFGFALLSRIAELAGGKPYPELLNEFVLRPVGAEHTTLALADHQRSSLVTPYRKDDRMRATQPWRMGAFAPPSATYSSTADLARLLRRQIAAYRAYAADGQTNRWILSDETFVKNVREPRDAYGYGFQTWDNVIFGHGGDMDGYASYYTIYPEKDFGFALLTASGEDWIGPLTGSIFGLIR